MKINQLVKATAMVIALAFAAPSSLALGQAQVTAIKKAMASVAPPEMPSKAAELVRNAAKGDREGVAVAAVRAAILKNRSTAAAVVAAVTKEAPDLASAVTLAATLMERAQVGAIASAAITAAPESRTEITRSALVGYGNSVVSTPAVASTLTGSGSGALDSPFSTPAPTPVGSPAFSTVRGGGGGGGGYAIVNSNTPINQQTGGSGAGTYENAGTISAGPAIPLDYTTVRQ